MPLLKRNTITEWLEPLSNVPVCVLIVWIKISAWNFTMKPQIVNNVLVCIRGISVFVAEWPEDQPGLGVPVQSAGHGAQFRTTRGNIQVRSSQMCFRQAPPVIWAHSCLRTTRMESGKKTWVSFCWFKAELRAYYKFHCH